MSQIIQLGFQGREVEFTSEGWFNATAAAEHFGKRLQNYLDNLDTKDYMAALRSALNHSKESDLIRASRGKGGGTWFHPKLAVHFARWLNTEFAVWCDIQIDNLIRGGGDQRLARHAAASSHKMMCKMLQAARLAEGKETKSHHYANESKLVNWSVGASFEALNRDQMTAEQLDALSSAEIQNAVMIGSRLPYDERKGLVGQQRIPAAPTHPLPRKLPKRKAPKAA